MPGVRRDSQVVEQGYCRDNAGIVLGGMGLQPVSRKGGKGTFYFFASFRGRPRGFSDDCSPSRNAVARRQAGRPSSGVRDEIRGRTSAPFHRASVVSHAEGT